MKKYPLLVFILSIAMVGCSSQAVITSTASVEIATTTPEVYIALTQAIPGQIQLNGIALAVQGGRIGACDLPECEPASPGMKYLSVTLQAVNLQSGESLEYKNLPQGIAIHDETGMITSFDRLLEYKPVEQQLILYFAVPEAAMVFGLQWPGSTEIPLTVSIDETIDVQPTSFAGTEVTYGPITLVVPAEVADGASGKEVLPFADDDAAWWSKTPGHTEVNLADYYILQNKFHQPVIYVYPATDYAILVPNAFESIHRLRNIIAGVVPITPDQLPIVPFFNAAQVFASNIQEISFQNGRGVRFLTEYAQYSASGNNQDLFYHFQGLSDEGDYFIIAILPITMSKLAETSDGDAVLPPGGISYTYFNEGSDFDAQAYYDQIVELLNDASPESFTPTISQLDALIQSIIISP